LLNRMMPDPDLTLASSPAGSRTVLDSESSQGTPAVLKLKLKKPRPTRRVQWTEETIDNENMNKKKSKCCCIYKKPVDFGESESEDSDSDCEHCSHHTPKDFVASRDDTEKQTVEEKQSEGEEKDEPVKDDENPIETAESSSSEAVDPNVLLTETCLKDSVDSGGKAEDVNSKETKPKDPDCNNNSRKSIKEKRTYPNSQLRNGNYPSSSRAFCCRHSTKSNTRENGKSNYALPNSSIRNHPADF